MNPKSSPIKSAVTKVAKRFNPGIWDPHQHSLAVQYVLHRWAIYFAQLYQREQNAPVFEMARKGRFL